MRTRDRIVRCAAAFCVVAVVAACWTFAIVDGERRPAHEAAATPVTEARDDRPEPDLTTAGDAAVRKVPAAPSVRRDLARRWVSPSSGDLPASTGPGLRVPDFE